MNKLKILLPIFILILILSGCNFSNKSPNQVPFTPNVAPSKSAEGETKRSEVGLPSGEDIVRAFFALINEKRIPEAVSMLSSIAAPNDSTKQTWGVNFNTLDSISIKSIEEWQKSDWTENKKTYKVIVVAQVKPNPQFYAWEDGENTKWINLIKENNLWKISEIATGP